MQGDLATEDRRRTVGLVVVLEGAATAHRVLHVRQRGDLAVIHIVLAAQQQFHRVALGYDDAGRPDFDVEFIDFARCQRLVFVVRVIRPGLESPEEPFPTVNVCGE